MASVEPGSLPPPSGRPRPSAIAQIVIGLAICAVAASVVIPACGGGQQLGPLVRCKVDAVTKVVPEDPNQLTIGDLLDIIGRLRECREAATGDAGR